ncbi:MAG: radical SAM protein [Dehalococcoidia bacterium]
MTSISSAPGQREASWLPEVVSWNITQACNLRCPHCYLAGGRASARELSFRDGCLLIDDLASAGTRLLILSGGEPLLRRDIVDLARYAVGRGLVVVVGSNGTLLTQARVANLRQAGVSGVGISLDSALPEKHDAFRGVAGAWKGAVRGIQNCVAEGLSVLVQMTVLPWNFTEVDAVAALAQEMGAVGFNLYFLVCTGRGEELTDITPAQYEATLGALVEIQKRYPQMMVRARCAPQISRVASQRGSPLLGNAGCMAGRQYCRITPEGDLTPCPYLPLAAGNVRATPFTLIWETSPILRRLRRDAPSGRCGRCNYVDLCGGCRARAFALTGDLMGEDIWCSYQPPMQGARHLGNTFTWSEEAQGRLHRIPAFIRGRVKTAVERYALARGVGEITPAILAAALEGMGRRLPFRRPSLGEPGPR